MNQKLFSCVAIYIVIYGIIIQAIKFNYKLFCRARGFEAQVNIESKKCSLN